MTSVRHKLFPLEHLDAEIAAFPLWHPASLRLAVTQLNPISQGPQSQLWREAERWLVNTFSGLSIDESVHLRDHWWFQNCQTQPTSGMPVPLHRYLRQLSSSLLQRNGPTGTPRLREAEQWSGLGSTGHAPAAARRLWRWISASLPPDLLLAALGEPGDVPTQILALNPGVRQLLEDGGFAEVHQHIGAAIEFPAYWIATLKRIAQRDFQSSAFKSPGAEMNEGNDIAPWLVRAGIVRYLLGAFLKIEAVRQPQSTRKSFARFLSTDVATKLQSFHAWTAPLLLRCCQELRGGDSSTWSKSVTFGQWQEIYAELTAVRARRAGVKSAGIARLDCLHGLFNCESTETYAEQEFIVRGLKYLHDREATSTDETDGDRVLPFAQLFWQVIRVRNLLYRHVVQRPMTPGLQWFIRSFGRLGPGKRDLPMEFWIESSSRMTGEGIGLRSLEVRTAPDNSLREFWPFYKNLLRQLSDSKWHPRLEIGYVLHFTKERGGGAGNGTPNAHGFGSNADPGSFAVKPASGDVANNTGYRFASYYRQRERQASAWERLYRDHPEALLAIRGIDVCTDELGIPAWVLRPLFRRVRAAADLARTQLLKSKGLQVPGLRTTIHVGEDYVHLLTGLRNVDEAFRCFDLREGDRIGHGVALGVDPSEWSHRAGRTMVTRETRWHDLLWLRLRCGYDHLNLNVKLQTRICDELQRLTDDMFGTDFPGVDIRGVPRGRVTFEELREFVEDLRNERRILEWSGFPNAVMPPALRTRRDCLVISYLRSAAIFHAGQTVIAVDAHREEELLAAVQNALRRELSNRSLVVEVNPTSNLLIGDLTDLDRHPLWRMRPPRKDSSITPIPIAIGSDDPITFATSLPNEYQHIYDTLVLAGIPETDVIDWLEAVRETGMRQRFTLSRSLFDKLK